MFVNNYGKVWLNNIKECVMDTFSTHDKIFLTTFVEDVIKKDADTNHEWISHNLSDNITSFTKIRYGLCFILKFPYDACKTGHCRWKTLQDPYS